MAELQLQPEREVQFVFIGVSTGASSIQRIFPAWMKALDMPNVKLKGIDLPLGAKGTIVAELMESLRTDNRVVGGLVTSHKLSVFRGGLSAFAELSPVARQLEEVSGLYKLAAGVMAGWAADPPAMAAALNRMGVGAQYWAQHVEAEVVCFGCGGAATALAYAIYGGGEVTDVLPRLRVTDVDLQRLTDLERKCKLFLPRSTALVTFHRADQTDATGWPGGQPTPHSLIVNATGMGKDVPGSPLPRSARFPAGAVVWELNYRGEREFMQQAGLVSNDLELRIEDGWELFLLGWTSVVERTFGMKLSDLQMQELSQLAADAVGREAPTTVAGVSSSI